MHFIKGLSAFKPTKFNGCALWLKADAGVTTVDGKVSAWADQSGNGNHATQSTADSRPLYVASAQGGRPTLRFDGSGDNLYLSSVNSFPSGASTRTAIVVLKTSDTSRRNDVFGFGNWAVNNAWGLLVEVTSGNLYISHNFKDIRGTSTPTTGYTICSSVLEGANVSSTKLYKNGQSLPVSLVFSDGAVDTLYSVTTGYIGDSQTHTNPFYGDISEIIIFNRALTSYERQRVEQYLSEKYAIEVTKGPENIPDCSLWLKADAGVTTVDGKVSAWADQSGNGNHAAQTTSNYRPAYVASAQGGRPTLRFDGSNNKLVVPSFISGTTSFSMFICSKLTGGLLGRVPFGSATTGSESFYALAYQYSPQSGNKHISAWGAAIGKSTSSQDYSYSDHRIFTSVYNGTTHITYLNGVAGTTANYSNSNLATGNWYVGTDAYNSYFGGDISEIIIFNRALTDAERVKVEQYLSGKYAITLS